MAVLRSEKFLRKKDRVRGYDTVPTRVTQHLSNMAHAPSIAAKWELALRLEQTRSNLEWGDFLPVFGESSSSLERADARRNICRNLCPNPTHK